jgi:hypothetical protein
LVFCGGGGGVAAEAETRFVGRDGAACGSVESCWDSAWLARGDVEHLRRVVETYMAFVELGVLLVDESLAHVAGAESPEEIDRKRSGCVADSEDAFFLGGEELIGVGAGLKRQVGVVAQALGVGRARGGVEHGGGLGGFGFEFVALGASVGAGVVGAGRLAFCWPPAWSANTEFRGQGDAARLRSWRLLRLGARGETRDN